MISFLVLPLSGNLKPLMARPVPVIFSICNFLFNRRRRDSKWSRFLLKPWSWLFRLWGFCYNFWFSLILMTFLFECGVHSSNFHTNFAPCSRFHSYKYFFSPFVRQIKRYGKSHREKSRNKLKVMWCLVYWDPGGSGLAFELCISFCGDFLFPLLSLPLCDFTFKLIYTLSFGGVLVLFCF